MAALTVNDASRINPINIDASGAYGAPFETADQAGGDTFVNEANKVIAIIHNEDGSANAEDVTFATNFSRAGIALPDEVVTVADGNLCIIGPFPSEFHQQGGTTVNITYEDASSSVKILILKVGHNDS